MPTKSLSLRVALIAAGGSALALLVAGAVFIVQFSNAVERNFDARLETLLLTLITATNSQGEVDESAVEGSSGGTFSRPLSGWYWQSRDAATGRAIDWSESLSFDILPIADLPTDENPARILTIEASGGRELRALEQLVSLGEGRTFALLVAGDTQPMLEDIASFRSSVTRWLGGSRRPAGPRHGNHPALGIAAAPSRARGPQPESATAKSATWRAITRARSSRSFKTSTR